MLRSYFGRGRWADATIILWYPSHRQYCRVNKEGRRRSEGEVSAGGVEIALLGVGLAGPKRFRVSGAARSCDPSCADEKYRQDITLVPRADPELLFADLKGLPSFRDGFRR